MKKILSTLLSVTIILSMLCFNTNDVESQTDFDTSKIIKSTNGGLDDYSEMYGYEALDTNRTRNFSMRNAAGKHTYNYLAIFVEFPDQTAYDLSQAQSNAETIFNSDGFECAIYSNYKKRLPSVKSYFSKYSFGKETIKATMFPQNSDGKIITYKTSHDKGYYQPYDAVNNTDGYTSTSQQNSREIELVLETMAAVKTEIEKKFSGSDLDVNNDGCVDALSFFIEGDDADWGDLLWSHKISGYDFGTLCGKSIFSYNLIQTGDHNKAFSVFSLTRAGYGTIIHEFLHTLGLPDLYRYNDETAGNPVGVYDIMASTKSYDPQPVLTGVSYYYELGWKSDMNEYNVSTNNIIIDKPTYQDEAENNAIILRPKGNEEQFFVVEYYKKDDGYTAATDPDQSGLIVYRIDKTKSNGNKEATARGGDSVYVFRPGETSLSKLGGGNIKQATLSLSNRNTYGKTLEESYHDFDNTTIFYSDGSNSGIKLEIVGETESTITINVTMPQVNGSGTQADPYLIYTAQEFISLLSVNKTNNYYKIMRDLDFSQMTLFNGIDYLNGHLDGNNKTIKNININGSGLFGIINDNATLHDLTIENINVVNTGLGHTGSLCANSLGSVSNVVVKSGTVKGNPNSDNSLASTGGFIGVAEGTLDNCGSSVDILQGLNVGGFVGMITNTVTIKNCYCNGKVNKGTKKTGGFIGLEAYLNSKSISNCYYDMKKAGLETSIGTSTNSNIIGCSISDISLTVYDKSAISFVTKPSKFVNYSVLIDDNTIGSYNTSSKEIEALNEGNTIYHVSINVGTHQMLVDAYMKVTGLVNTKILLNETNKTIATGQSFILQARMEPYNTTFQKTITWSSSDSSIVSVDSNGKVTALRPGTVMITVKAANGAMSSCKVNVYDSNKYYIQNKGLCWIKRDGYIDVGAAYSTNDPNAEFQWKAYNVDTKKWVTVSNWSKGNWASWKAERGNYWLVCDMRTSDGLHSAQEICWGFRYDFDDFGIYAGPTNGGILLGCNSQIKGVSYYFKIYNLTTKKWDWGSKQKSIWAIWRPIKGNYWTHYEVYSSDNRLIGQQTYCFAVN